MLLIKLMIIAFIGRTFHELADKYHKHLWAYTLMGIATFYAVIIVSSNIINLLWARNLYNAFESTSQLIVQLISLPIALLSTWFIYAYLSRKFKLESPGDIDTMIKNFGVRPKGSDVETLEPDERDV